MKYLAKVSYLGTDFNGFQVQPNLRTVHGEFERAMKELFRAPLIVKGCSRTDAGVHANGCCITVECDTASIPPHKLPLAAIPFLPPDISILDAVAVDSDFHVRYDVYEKEYLYRIRNARVPSPFEHCRSWFLPQIISETGLENMRQAAAQLVGKHDFCAFMSEGSDVTDTVREVHFLTVEKKEDIIEIRIGADGYLYNMVRIIVGTLVEVALGRRDPMDISSVLLSRERAKAGMTAPACGLYLDRVKYKNGFSF